MQDNKSYWLTVCILFCHFISAFAVLGVAPFFGEILTSSFGVTDKYWTGLFYATPTLLLAIFSPIWGHFADKIGKKKSLLRAQLGLAFSFLIAAHAPNITVYFLAICAQGILGGTLSASNALLASCFRGTHLAVALDGTQSSARLAFIVAPIVIGWGLMTNNPLNLYHYLVWLPLLAAVILFFSPISESKPDRKRDIKNNNFTSGINKKNYFLDKKMILSMKWLHSLQFVVAFVSVLTYPYFSTYMQHMYPETTLTVIGILFSLPHIAYLFCQPLLSKKLMLNHAESMVISALFILGVSLVLQVLALDFRVFICIRIIMGISMAVAISGLNRLIAEHAEEETAGKTFGFLDMFSKLAGFFAGIASSLLVTKSLALPFILSASIAVFFASILFFKMTASVVSVPELNKANL